MIPAHLQEKIDRLCRDPRVKAALEQSLRDLCDKGLVMEAGWQAWRTLVMARDASTVQTVETKRAFYAGAYHLFSSIMFTLEPESEPTDADMRRMDQLHNELRAFFKEPN